MKRNNRSDIEFSLYVALTLGVALALYGSMFANVQSQNEQIWLKASDLPQQTQFAGLSRHAAAVYDDVMYVIGGAGRDVDLQSNKVLTGEINEDGSISEWGSDGTLLKPLTYAPVAVTKEGCIYLTGGRSGTNAQFSVVFGTVANGSPISWREENMPGFLPRYLHAMIISGDKLFALGGFDRTEAEPLGDVTYLNLANDCTKPVSDWMPAPPLNPPRAAHAAVAFEERIYVIGGFEGGSTSSDISASVHFAATEGSSLSQWEVITSTLPIPLAYHTAFVSEADRRIYVAGGLMPSGDASDKVYSAYVNHDGRLLGNPQDPTKWQEEPTLRLPVPLYRHATVLAENGTIYVIGGQTQDQNKNTVNQSQVYYTISLANKSSKFTSE